MEQLFFRYNPWWEGEFRLHSSKMWKDQPIDSIAAENLCCRFGSQKPFYRFQGQGEPF